MGVLDGLLSQIQGSLSGDASQQGGLANSILSTLTSQGGLQGVIQTMKDKGLGAVAASWVGTGPNQPISPEQIQQILGNEKLQALAQQHGLNVEEIKSHLAQILPACVDQLTPNGTVPEGGIGGMLKGFMSGGT
jgi:uncharacterized protein YidB (DUF937 family)